MATITIQDLQDIAVQATSAFFNEQVSLNQSLAKQASERGLNSEQLKRAVEATNTLTHLKSMEVSGDRTAEFPVAEYTSILKLASVPDLSKYAEADEPTESLEKTASFEEEEFTLSPQEIVVYLTKVASANERALEDAKVELEIAGMQMLKKIAGLRSDPEFIEHLSASTISDESFTKVAKLVLGASTSCTRKDFVSGMFKSAALNEVETFVGLHKRAESLIGEVKERQGYHDRWITQKDMLTKQAFLGGIGKAISSVVGRGAAKVAPAVKPTPVSATERISFKVGSGVTKALTAPFKALGSATMNASGALGRVAGKKVNNAIAGTAVGKSLGIPVKPIDPNVTKRIKRLAAGATVVGGAMFDAQMFEPKVDPANDKSGRISNAL